MTVNQKLHAIREEMKKHQLDAYIIQSGDPHQSEYVADHWKGRQWISGFTGSAGTVVITQSHAGLWTDSRYFIQAADQLRGSEFELHKLIVPHTPEHLIWIRDHMPENARVGFDGNLVSVSSVRQMARQLDGKKIFLNQDFDLLQPIWKDRPSLPSEDVFEHPIFFAGKTRLEKLDIIRHKMLESGANHYLISTLDDIAWLFNLRGRDVECNPVFIAYAVVHTDQVFLFSDRKRFSSELTQKLKVDGVTLLPYGQINQFLKDLRPDDSILLDKGSTNIALFNLIEESCRIDGPNIVAPLKAVKNEVEINHFRSVMEKDGIALTKLFRWLEDTLPIRTISEVEVARQLIQFRSTLDGYYGESFDAIVGYQSNGAIVHYRAEPDNCAQIKSEGILLLDCGGQYTDGTTDITRTIALSPPTAQQILDFTLVLKGHIAVAMARFPAGTNGLQLDALARQHLWRHVRNYGHGTGHGVGFFLNVHEGPQSISPTISPRTTMGFEPGTVTSNEPGLYRAGSYGIRIENLVLCIEDNANEFGQFRSFETLTLFPMDTSLIDKTMLSKEELTWVNDYHAEVLRRLKPHLDKDEVEWMERRCRPL